MTVVLFYTTFKEAPLWRKLLGQYIPDVDLRDWPDWGDAEDAEFAVVWEPPPGELNKYPNLRAIFP